MTDLAANPIRNIKPYGDFTIFYQYVNDQPAMVIASNRFRSERHRAWAILLESAWKYVDDPQKGSHSGYMMQVAPIITEQYLGLGRSKSAAWRVAEAILEGLQELLDMEPLMRPDVPTDDISGTINGADITGSSPGEVAKCLH